MKRLLVIFIALTMIGTNQANTISTAEAPSASILTIGMLAKIATKKEQALVKSPRIPKPKLFRSNPYRISYYNFNLDDNDDLLIQDEDIYVGYRRQDLEKIKAKPTIDDPDGLITEEIRWKLFLARTAAMIRYKQIHG